MKELSVFFERNNHQNTGYMPKKGWLISGLCIGIEIGKIRPEKSLNLVN